MNYFEALSRIIDEGIAAARVDYVDPGDKASLDGSIAGFEACRNLTPDAIAELLASSSKAAAEAFDSTDLDAYWYKRCYHLEIEWVANVLSAIMQAQGWSPIVPTTARGVIKAAEVLGGGCLDSYPKL